ncbi:MAG: GHMP family kinase ATP-binding protein [Armatimonadota bacterium]
MTRTVFSSAPCRIDFGGGTLDIYPLYLYFDGGITINAAINLDAQVWLTARNDDRVTIKSLDTGAELAVDGGVMNLPLEGPLALITRVLRFYNVEGGLDVQTRLQPPHGSGLGASSALFIALSHAVLAYQDKEREPRKIIRISNNLEAQLMKMPAGMQDYYPPTYGGINAVHYDIEDTWVEPLDPQNVFLPDLQSHALVTYTNITHHSGTTNWSKIRNFFDGVPRTVESFQRIKNTVGKFYDAFKARDIHEIATLLNEEWGNRKGMADGVTNPEIDALIKVAEESGSWANKICGAGGGGCMLTIVPPEKRQAVKEALEAAGATYMDAQLVPHGVQVKVEG